MRKLIQIVDTQVTIYVFFPDGEINDQDMEQLGEHSFPMVCDPWHYLNAKNKKTNPEAQIGSFLQHPNPPTQ